jgi:hypothetical protein
MANIGDIAISILAGNLNSGLSYLITTLSRHEFNHIVFHDKGFWEDTHTQEMSESHKKICNK